ncbi:hypothetical protein D3C73_1228300 [compost metagenome]
MGICQPISDASLACGMDDDTAVWSSPTTTSTPPLREAPAALPWCSASPARSTPGPLPYHMANTPSTLRSARTPACCVPMTAVAAMSSLMPGRNEIWLASSAFFAFHIAMSTPPSGDPR